MENKQPPHDSHDDEHEYDGIRELNNPAPFWWQMSFYLSILFALVYYAYYELGTAPSSDQLLAESMAKVLVLQNQNRPSGPDVKQLLTLTKDAESLNSGKSTFISKCAACHVADGGGLVGPNLADAAWLHGRGKLADLYATIRNGVPDKGMPAWGSLLSEPELNQVVAYVKNFQGTKPSNPKAPQGIEVSLEESKD